MALIKCPDCGNTVSDKSEVCLKCGRPIAKAEHRAPDPATFRPPVQTIEKTSKKLKGWLAVCMATFGVSCLMLMVGGAVNSDMTMGISLILFLISAFGIGVVKVKIWWEHE